MKKTFFFISIAIILFFSINIKAQNPQCQWAEKISGDSTDNTHSICTDVSGNVYVAGRFYSPTLTFNNGKTLSNSGNWDGFIAKYNGDGVCQWAEKIAGTDYDYAYSISTDVSGNVYVAGYFGSDTLTFNNGKILSNGGCGDGFITKYNGDGVCQWAVRIAGTGYEILYSISTDANGNVYVAGDFNNTLLLNYDKKLSNTGRMDVFIAKYNSDGELEWAKKIAGTTDEYANSISTDINGNVYVAGYYDSPKLTFNNGKTLSNSGNWDGFIAKYNSDGVCQWAKKIAGTDYDNSFSIITDANGNVYVAGEFSSAKLTFNNSITLSNSGSLDSYIAKYNSYGLCRWAEKIAGTDYDNSFSIITDVNGNVYVAGIFLSATLTFNNGRILSNSGSGDGYITKYNGDGVCQWVEKIGGTDNEYAHSIIKDVSGNVYVTGYFRSAPLRFNNGKTVSSNGSGDGFIAKYTESPQGIPFLSSPTNNAMLFLSPNPVNDNYLNIAFNLATPEQVTIEIANIPGEIVSVVKANEFFPQGEHSIKTDISNFPAGAYFCILRYKDKVIQQQFIRY